MLNLISNDDRRSLAVVMTHLRSSVDDVMILARRAVRAPDRNVSCSVFGLF